MLILKFLQMSGTDKINQMCESPHRINEHILHFHGNITMSNIGQKS